MSYFAKYNLLRLLSYGLLFIVIFRDVLPFLSLNNVVVIIGVIIFFVTGIYSPSVVGKLTPNLEMRIDVLWALLFGLISFIGITQGTLLTSHSSSDKVTFIAVIGLVVMLRIVWSYFRIYKSEHHKIYS
ncbi:choline-glycine betaine transporter [Bacillus pakistanensis]|uniref:Choline-glycine betaine transporter n=1 Tax=Rossellomorea pakistanensis TaxID=992288 RepID=A0ABS2NEY6_9BACI|nr:hypothetical protein [Bacillus pakistanensis]MBM7586413.1 choline-glycine betaine transporter [Bacillus pakistanensis]